MRRLTGKYPNNGSVADAFASRGGLAIAVALLMAICVWAVQTVEQSVSQLERDQRVFTDRQLRNGFVAMSDIQRVLLVAKEAKVAGRFSDAQKADFVEAVDILFVRKDNFERVLKVGDTLVSAESAVAALNALIDIADQAIASNYTDVDALVDALLTASAEAREHLVLFLDDMDRTQSAVLRNQSKAVAEQRTVVLASLAALTLLAVLAMVFLRREVAARRAREKAERDVQFLAYFDQLTQLPNRTQFQDRLERRLSKSTPTALLFVDVDAFKAINDTHGHGAGDAILKHVANVLAQKAERARGFAARLGGDEFAVVLPTEHMAQLKQTCGDILETLSGGYRYDGEEISLSVSIGLSTLTQLGETRAPSVDALCRVTDFALYASKSNGRKQFTLYDNALEQRFLQRRAIIEELPAAIQNEDLLVYFQPKVALKGGLTYGFEALVRWKRHGTLMPPDEFIGVAEESGLILELDRAVLFTAVKLIARYNQAYRAAFSVSVNLSALHFSSPRIVAWIEQALATSELEARLLTVEITETVEMSDWKQARDIIARIRALGVRISIDDFGTGYSSLSYLRTTSADELKIDRSLVEKVETSDKARFLLDAVLDMANNLELEVVVEGIETAEQAQTLMEMGADFGQGFLYGRPVPAEDALAALSHSQASFGKVG